jgi:hypothetical protein
MVSRINSHTGQCFRLCRQKITALTRSAAIVLTNFAAASMIGTILIGATLGYSQPIAAAEFTARVDRTVVTEGESLRLLLRITDLNSPSEPDVSALRQDFELSSPSFSSQQQTILGKGTQGFREWRYSLTPKHLGILTIPAFKMDGQTTDPILIKVKPMSAAIKKQLKQSLFFNVSTSHTEAYVQGQILYTERLYFSLPLVNHQLTELKIPDAVVIPLNEGTLFQAQYQGKAYQVIERQFAIFPQTSGPLTIPSQHYQGETRSSYFSQGKTMSASTDAQTIDIRPRPADYPKGAAWLPANLLSLAAQWEGDPSSLKQGEPITLTLILSSEGLSSAQLPSIQLPNVDGLKYYEEPPKTEDKTIETGVSSTKTFKIAIIPTKAGQHQIPDLHIPWYSIPDDQLKEARLSFPLITVAGASSAAPTHATPLGISKHKPQPAHTPDLSESQGPPVTTEQSTPATAMSQYPKWLLGILMLLCLSNGITLYLWYRTACRNEAHGINQHKDTKHPDIGTQQALKTLKRAVQRHKAAATCSACLVWAKAQWPDFEGGLNDIAEQLNDAAAQAALKALDAYLFGYGDQWDGTAILQALQQYQPQKQPQSHQGLISLYPPAA